MALLEGKTPAERNKTIAAIVLGGIALISISYMLLGSSSAPAKKTTSNSNSPRASASPTPRPVVGQTARQPGDEGQSLDFLRPVNFTFNQPAVPEAGRNIFAYYEGPPPPPKSTAIVEPSLPPTPTPTPPNVVLASVSPVNVYARTGDFTLEVTGDKFTPDVRIEINGTQLPTRFISAQQLSASVNGSLISSEGPRTISVRSPDGQLFSNTATLNVQAPPTPNYTFVGLLAKRSYNDTALLKDRGSRELLSVQRGDLLGGRFRITSISEREVALIDTNLKIKHSLPLTTDSGGGSNSPGAQPGAPATGFPNPNQRYTPPPQGDDDDDEP
ncbi:MAG TPA: hypothetical protein VF528_17345 [Pyrinomonadaceae bacterium]|jgi:hypothetical protein